MYIERPKYELGLGGWNLRPHFLRQGKMGGWVGGEWLTVYIGMSIQHVLCLYSVFIPISQLNICYELVLD